MITVFCLRWFEFLDTAIKQLTEPRPLSLLGAGPDRVSLLLVEIDPPGVALPAEEL